MQASQHRVLVVEDNNIRSYVLAKNLEALGFEVIVASCGTDALSIAQREHPTIILTDVKLPDMNGFEICRTVKASLETDHIPVVIYSSYAPAGNSESQEAGAVSFLTFPIENVHLRHVLLGAIAQAKAELVMQNRSIA